MALWLRDVDLPVGGDDRQLREKVARLLKIAPENLLDFKVVRRSLDARKKPRLRWVFTVEFSVDDDASLLRRQQDNPRLSHRVKMVLDLMLGRAMRLARFAAACQRTRIRRRRRRDGRRGGVRKRTGRRRRGWSSGVSQD